MAAPKAFRVVARYLMAARPIPIDKGVLRTMAKAIVRELPKHLKYRPDDMDSPLYYARGYRPSTWGFYPHAPKIVIERDWSDKPLPLPKGSWPDTSDVRGNDIGLVMTKVESKYDPSANYSSPRFYVHGGRVTGNLGREVRLPGGRSRSEFKFQKKTDISVSINSARTPNELLENLDKVEKEVFSVLIHEQTHLRDLLRGNPEGYSDNADTYHNTSTEIRAFMQQISDEVLEFVEDKARKTDGWGISQVSGDLMWDALYQSITWRRIKDSLTPRNRKLVLKGVATAVQDAQPGLLQKYYKDFDDEDF